MPRPEGRTCPPAGANTRQAKAAILALPNLWIFQTGFPPLEIGRYSSKRGAGGERHEMWLFGSKRDRALEERAFLIREEAMRLAEVLMGIFKSELLEECSVDPQLGRVL